MEILPPFKDLLFGFELEGLALRPISETYDFWGTEGKERYAKQLSSELQQTVLVAKRNHDWDRDKWTVARDESISALMPWRTGIELKSPVFAQEALHELPATFEAIRATKLKTNVTCGFHLQIGRCGQLDVPARHRFAFWQPDELVRLMNSFADNIHHIRKMVSPVRRFKNHCRPNELVSRDQTEKILDDYASAKVSQVDAIRMLDELYCPKKFMIGEEGYTGAWGKHAVNFHSMFDKGTVEITLRQASDYVNATPFIGVMLHMAQAAIDGREFNWNDYAAMVANDPLLALPKPGATPSRPKLRPQSLPASAAPPG